MEAVQRLGPRAGELVAPIGQQPQHHQLRIQAELAYSLVPQRDHHDGVRVDGIGLAALAGVEHPRPSGQLGRHVHHSLPVSEQPLGQLA